MDKCLSFRRSGCDRGRRSFAAIRINPCLQEDYCHPSLAESSVSSRYDS